MHSVYSKLIPPSPPPPNAKWQRQYVFRLIVCQNRISQNHCVRSVDVYVYY